MRSTVTRETKVNTNLMRYNTKGKLLGTSQGTKTITSISTLDKPYSLSGRQIIGVGKVFIMILFLVFFARFILNTGRTDFDYHLSLKTFLDFLTGQGYAIPSIDLSLFSNLTNLIPNISGLDLGIFNFLVEGLNLWIDSINLMIGVSFLVVGLIWNLFTGISFFISIIFS